MKDLIERLEDASLDEAKSYVDAEEVKSALSDAGFKVGWFAKKVLTITVKTAHGDPHSLYATFRSKEVEVSDNFGWIAFAIPRSISANEFAAKFLKEIKEEGYRER